jgi:hypothetical protein
VEVQRSNRPEQQLPHVAERAALLVERGGTVRGAWRYDAGEVPDFDELLAAA